MKALQNDAAYWNCSHTTNFVRCSKCNLIFCGKCQNVLFIKRFSKNNDSLALCPNCGGFDLINITPAIIHSINSTDIAIDMST